MIALDTNILVYAHRRDSEWHEAAAEVVRRLAEGTAPWALPWPCAHEFLAIVTHPGIYDPPTPRGQALAQVDAWLESPTVVTLAEPDAYWPDFRDVATVARASGARVHDARVAAMCIVHRIEELWTADRDFSRFSGLATRNPLPGAARD